MGRRKATSKQLRRKVAAKRKLPITQTKVDAEESSCETNYEIHPEIQRKETLIEEDHFNDEDDQNRRALYCMIEFCSTVDTLSSVANGMYQFLPVIFHLKFRFCKLHE